MLTACSNTKPIAVSKPQPPTTPTITVTKPIQISTSLEDDSILLNAHVGISVYDIAEQKYLHQYNSDKYFMPSSNIKLFTCYAAMKYLGDSLIGVRYKEDEHSILLQGTGDPTFLMSQYKTHPVFEFLKTKNKTLQFDSTNWDEQRLGQGWAWDDYGDDYSAERSSFPIYGNTIKFFVKDSMLTAIPSYDLQVSPLYSMDKHPKKDSLPYFHLKNLPRYFDVKRISPDNEIFGIKESNSTFTKAVLPRKINEYENLAFLSDTLTGTHTAKEKAVLYQRYYTPNTFTNSIKSQPTDSVLKPMMYFSNNFFAEQSLLMISNEKLGVMNTADIIDTLLANDFKALPQKPRWVDGSGLSRYNLFSPNDFIWLLTKMKNDFEWSRITNILTTTNQGTLKGYYTNYAGNIYAKTGSMSNNIALSGYLITKQKKTLAFSIMINNHMSSSSALRRAMEKYLTNIIDTN